MRLSTSLLKRRKRPKKPENLITCEGDQDRSEISQGNSQRPNLKLVIPTSKYNSIANPADRAGDLATIAPWTEQELAPVWETEGLQKSEQPPSLPPVKAKNRCTTASDFAIRLLGSASKSEKPQNPKRISSFSSFKSKHERTAESDPVVQLLVGKQDPQSRYFTPRVFVVRSSALKHTNILTAHHGRDQHAMTPSLIELPDLDPIAFEFYYEYLRTGMLKLSKRIGLGTTTPHTWTWTSCWPLLNAHLLSTAIGDMNFGEYILSLLETLLAHSQPADYTTIQHLFTTPGVSQDLKNFVTDTIIMYSRQDFSSRQMALFPASFVYLALRRSLRLLNLASRPTGSQMQMDINMRSVRNIRDTLEGVITTKESINARKRAERNGVDCIDWAERVQGPTADADMASRVAKAGK